MSSEAAFRDDENSMGGPQLTACCLLPTVLLGVFHVAYATPRNNEKPGGCYRP